MIKKSAHLKKELLSLLSNTDARLTKYEYSNMNFGNLIIEIQTNNKSLRFVSDRGDILCNNELIYDSSYIGKGESTFSKMFEAISLQLHDNVC